MNRLSFPPAGTTTLCVATLLAFLAAAIAAPELGLGRRDEFILYKALYISRTLLGWTSGLLLAAILVASATRAWKVLLTPPAVLGPFRASLSRFLRKLVTYYALPPAVAAQEPSRREQAIVLLVALACQIAFLIAIRFGYECDAAGYFSFARALAGFEGGQASYYRPPLYPLFLLVTGFAWAQTSVPLLLAHAALGTVAPLIMLRTLYGLGRVPAFIGTGALMATAIPFVLAKLMLTEQLYLVLQLLTLLNFVRYFETADPRRIYAFVAFGLATMFTRWEAQFLLVFGLVGLLIASYRLPRQFRHALLAVAVVGFVVSGYSFVRAWKMDDSRLIGTLQNGTGGQLLWMTYGRDKSPGKIADFFSSKPPAERSNRFVSPDNGPATREMLRLVALYAAQHPQSYQNLRTLLDPFRSERHPNPYEELFGRFDGAPDKLIQNILTSVRDEVTDQYAAYMIGAVQVSLGLADSDRLLRQVFWETLIANPLLYFLIIREGLELVGLDLTGIFWIYERPFELESWSKMVRWPSNCIEPNPFTFDAGGCATATMPPRLLDETKAIFAVYYPSFSAPVAAAASFGRNLVRLIAGFSFLLLWWSAIFLRRRWLYLPLVGVLFLTIGLVGAAALAACTRTEYAMLPPMIFVSVTLWAEIVRWFRRKK